LQVPAQQRLPLPTLEHWVPVSHGTQTPLALQIGSAGSVHWPLLQHSTAKQDPPQHFWPFGHCPSPVQATQVPPALQTGVGFEH
jgi:hypothetical protein